MGIGDNLAVAKRAYPSLSCHPSGTRGEYAVSPGCEGFVSPRRWVAITEDPIEEICVGVTNACDSE